MKKISEAAADAWGVPKDVIMNIPRITVSGDREIYIENHRGVSAYTAEHVGIVTGMGIVKIYGKNLKIAAIRHEDVLVTGRFIKIEFSSTGYDAAANMQKEVKNVK